MTRSVQLQRRNAVGRRVRQAAAVSAVVTSSALVGTVGLSYYVAHVLTAPHRRKGQVDDYVITPFETGAEFEEVAFP